MPNKSPEAPLTVACLQMEPVFGDTERNIATSISMIEQAAAQGARLMVLPELCNTGYVFASRAEAFALAETIPGGPSTRAWCNCAAQLNVYLVAGITEREGESLYNSAVVIGPEGFIGRYRKVHLWGDEALYFEPGNLGFPVFKTRIGTLGCQICYDCWFPESFRMAALQGAEIVCVPTNWVPIPGQDPHREAMANILVMAASHSNSLYIAAADRVGTERGQPFIGQSLITSYTGWPVAGPASVTQPEIVIATVNLADAKRHRNWNDFNQVLKDRRPETYEPTGVVK
ncbi:nitrilase family protein [Rouxiella badensis]|jgi:N-carbamoylputrescine amidase|uniref:nitrilase family protein n=1 Tax=Rouxiella badensis TaxID=1646377 RepID=UPI0013EF4F65|nr:nitrilase family protein [Rouxiella badensis]MCC3701959.1 nitrilase family protein [Rouxiella badensis]MCC3718117.1 nitrilase family protein [Rouxiella badensis]MCC3727115.1 nitrilase family protein [Rouxiella badensis]MCC3731601.1 nitrilase family protein [Rouxiella badensis]MCC3738536.1 nitrilase family protein [Rouxiella badensis]